MQDTIFKVKAEMGSDAIILNTRKFKEGGFLGFFGREKVEVLAGVEEDTNTNNRTKNSGVQSGTRKELDDIKNMIEKLNRNWQQDDFERTLDENCRELYQHLRDQEITKGILQEIIKPVQEGENRQEKLEILRDELVDLLGGPAVIDINSTPYVVALVGPTGVGKTTSIAKLAADFARHPDNKVGLITADTYRIAAVQQLKTYSDIINVPLEVVYNEEEFSSVLAGDYRNYDIVFVDTPGSSWDDKVQLGRLQKMLTGDLLDEVHLLISLNQKLDNMLKVIDEFSALKPDKILLTKIDEATSYGDLINLRSKCELPYSYYSFGQDVPDDIGEAEPQKLLPYLLGDSNG